MMFSMMKLLVILHIPKLASSGFHIVIAVCSVPKLGKSCVGLESCSGQKFGVSKKLFQFRVILIIYFITAHLLAVLGRDFVYNSNSARNKWSTERH